MGNNPKLISMKKMRPHLSNVEINDRLNAEEEMIIGQQTFKITQRILNNQEALKKWNELVTIYKGFKYVTDIDIGAIEKYCIAHAEYCNLLDIKNELCNKINDKLKLFHADTELKLDYNINKKMELLIKMEDRLFLNPSSRVKFAAAKANQPKESYLVSLGFDNV